MSMNAEPANGTTPYLDVCTELGRNESSRFEALADYFAFPAHITSDSAHVVFTDSAILTRALSAQIEQLRQADYASSDIMNLTVRSLNARTALIDGSFSRRDRHGDELAKIGIVYLVIDVGRHWRFATLTITSAGRVEECGRT